MTAKDVILKLAKHFEGLRLRAYRCPAGVWTIGYGATGRGIRSGVTWTAEQAEERLEKDTTMFLVASKNLCPKIDGEVHGAIADFAFNLGATRLAGSTLRRRINAEEWEEACNEILKWVWAGGRKLPGLIARRTVEAAYMEQ